MQALRNISWLGLAAIAFGGFLLLFAIPMGVSTPSNVRVPVLSPTFWPIIIGGAIVLLGLLMVLGSLMHKRAAALDVNPSTDNTDKILRLLAMAIMMIAMVWTLEKVGMVWASMMCFVAFALIVRTPRPFLSLVVAVVLPLLLYAFFAYVAGVAIPQGEFITLP